MKHEKPIPTSEFKTSQKWIATGYHLFAKEGPDGIHVERLARILHLNKSGFYYYFGDRECYVDRLVSYHYHMFDLFVKDVANCKNVDPDYVNILVKHKVAEMAQIQLVRNKSNPWFYAAHEKLDEKIDYAVWPIWAKYTAISNDPELAIIYHGLVRDVLYSRVNWENFDFKYIQFLVDEAKDIVAQMVNEKDPVS